MKTEIVGSMLFGTNFVCVYMFTICFFIVTECIVVSLVVLS